MTAHEQLPAVGENLAHPSSAPIKGGDRATMTGAYSRLVVLVGLVLAATLTFAVVGVPWMGEATRLLRGLGPLAPMACIGACAVLTVLVVPKPILAMSAGAVFGAALGTTVVVLGATLGATAAYLLARRAGLAEVPQRAHRHLAVLRRWLDTRGFVALLCARVIPVVPFSAINYGCGLLGVRLPEFIAATAIGIIPGTFVPAALGASLTDPLSAGFLTASAVMIVLAVAGELLRRQLIRRPRGRVASPPQPPPSETPTHCGPTRQRNGVHR